MIVSQSEDFFNLFGVHMLKSLALAFLMGFSCLFGLLHQSSLPPPRQDHLDGTSKIPEIRLQRAKQILATLIPHSENYNLLLSSNTSLGAEAVPPHVYSDKPTIIIYQGLLSPNRSNEEIAFVLAHELGHLELDHQGAMNRQMEKIFTSHPIQISGTTFAIYFQKFQEREADLFGFNLYKKAHYDLAFFSHTLSLIKINPNIHFGTNNPFRKETGSLSMANSHFGIKERFELLTNKAQTA